MASQKPIITDAMTSGAGGFLRDVVGRTIVAEYEIEDTDRNEVLWLFDDGSSVLISCDPGYAEDLAARTPEMWGVVLYDATDTEAGKLAKDAQ